MVLTLCEVAPEQGFVETWAAGNLHIRGILVLLESNPLIMGSLNIAAYCSSAILTLNTVLLQGNSKKILSENEYDTGTYSYNFTKKP